ncbi:addiction module protein [bacterium]|nr:addiction module protein [bacterium]
MTRQIEKIENELLSLPQEERAFLADRLLSSLDREVLTDIDLAWINEAERRYAEYKNGKRKGINSDIVFSEADSLVK